MRELNKNIIVDKFPLPRINEMLAKTKGVKWFSTIDLTSAYHQIALTPHMQEADILHNFIRMLPIPQDAVWVSIGGGSLSKANA